MNGLKNISLATTYNLDDDFDSEKFIKMRLRVCHDGENPNGSSFQTKYMEAAESSSKNIPILAKVFFDENETPQFDQHNVEIEEDKVNEGEFRWVYKEQPIGVVPEDNNYTIEEYNGKNYVFMDGYIWRKYSNYAEDIIERDKEIKLSMEAIIDEYSYSNKEQIYKIKDYRYQGVTFLGNHVGTGMEKASAKIGEFTKEEKLSRDEMIFLMQELKASLDETLERRKGESMKKTKELKDKFDGEANDAEEKAKDSMEDGTNEEETVMNTVEVEDTSDGDKTEEDKTTEDSTEEDKTEDNYVLKYELSHDDIHSSLYKLLYLEEEQDEWTWILAVYDTYVVVQIHNYNEETNKYFKQSYEIDETTEEVSLIQDKTELFLEFLTKEEKDELENIKSEYSKYVSKERENQESELFAKFDEDLSEIKEYVELKENCSNMELQDIEYECYFMLGKLAVSKKDGVKADFSKKEKADDKTSKDLKIEVDRDKNKFEFSPYGELLNGKA